MAAKKTAPKSSASTSSVEWGDELPPALGGESYDIAEGEAFECTVHGREETTTRFGLRARYFVTTLEDETECVLWEKSGLRRLADCIGKTVRIEREADKGVGKRATQVYTIRVGRK